MMPKDDFEDEDIGTGAKGKLGELRVIGELLARGFKVYLPQVDTGIDAVVDVGDGNYREVQIKYREKIPIFNARSFKPRDNFYVVCWFIGSNGSDYWIIPSPVFRSLAKETKRNGKSYFQLGIGKEGSKTYEELAPYHHTFGHFLKGASISVQKEVRNATRARVEGEHLSARDLELAILRELDGESKPISTKNIIDRLSSSIGGMFHEADLETNKSDRRPRWEKNTRFVIYQNLKRTQLIEAKSKNQWVITNKGRVRLSELQKHSSSP